MPLTDTTLETGPSLLTEAGESSPALAVSPLGIRGIQVVIGGRDLTSRCDNIVFSATDQGGFEIATLGLPAVDRPKKGEQVTIRVGLAIAWMGRVAELADHSSHAHATKTVGCEGYAAILKDNPMQMIYIDRELGAFGQMPLSRAATLIAAAFNPSVFSALVTPDPGGGVPALTLEASAPLDNHPIGEAWYDAGPGNAIARLRAAAIADINWTLPNASVVGEGYLSTDDGRTEYDATGNELGGGAMALDLAANTTNRRYAVLNHFWNSAASVGSSGALGIRYSGVSVIGTHGLPLRGSSAYLDGFYPSDIVRHVLSQIGGIQAGVIEDSTGYIAPHLVYRTPTEKLQIVSDMAKLMGWTWGVWQPPTTLDSTPRLDFRAPPTDATVAVSKAECDELDITSRLGDLYDTAIVSYSDAAGTNGEVTVTLANPQLYETGVSERTLELEGGLSNEEAARTLGLFALQLSQIAARAAGQATLPASVKLPGGGSKPSALLRPGIDRLRITDLIDGGPLLEQGTGRRDVFRISRIETTIGANGAASTRVELDNGTNLLETLQARLALEAGVIGSGASG